MKNLKITKGEWKAERNKYYYNIILNNGEGYNIASTQQNKYIEIDEEVEKANAQLIADAGTTTNKCGKLPSELLAERDELLDVLRDNNKVITNFIKHYGNDMDESTFSTFNNIFIRSEKAINKTLSK